MKMRWGYTSNRRELATWAIYRVTKGPAHVFAIFYNGSDNPLYFESIVKKDKATGKNGVRGPIALTNVQEWQEEEPLTREFHVQPEKGFLPFTEEEVDRAYWKLAAKVHTIKYASLQIVQNWLAARIGLDIRLWRKSPRKWTCAETCFNCIPDKYWKFYGLPYATADDMAPGGTVLPSIEDGTAKLLRIHDPIS